MKIEFSKEWCLRMAEHEGDAEIGAGWLAIDPVFDGERVATDVGDEEVANGWQDWLRQRMRGCLMRLSGLPRVRSRPLN